MQTPPNRIDSLDTLLNTPIINGQNQAPRIGLGNGDKHGGAPAAPQLLQQSGRRAAAPSSPANINHYNVQPVYNVFANVQGRDLAAVAADVRRAIDAVRPDLPPGSTIAMRGQVETMDSSFTGLAAGLGFAVLLVYFLMVVNFQSWLDPFIILTALPGALAGIAWMLYVTQTTVTVPALMGAIMCIGVATSNSILVITFANDQRRDGLRRPQRGPVGRDDPLAAGADDGPGHDHRHAADVARLGRRRRAERAVGQGRHRRPAGGHVLHAVLRAGDVQPAPPQAAPRRRSSDDEDAVEPPAAMPREMHFQLKEGQF